MLVRLLIDSMSFDNNNNILGNTMWAFLMFGSSAVRRQSGTDGGGGGCRYPLYSVSASVSTHITSTCDEQLQANETSPVAQALETRDLIWFPGNHCKDKRRVRTTPLIAPCGII